MHPDKLAKTIREEIRLEFNKIDGRRRALFGRFPLLLGSMATLGMVFIFGGVSRVIERVIWLDQNPEILLGIGIFFLIITGSLYRKLN